jgi:hypothetical protein
MYSVLDGTGRLGVGSCRRPGGVIDRRHCMLRPTRVDLGVLLPVAVFGVLKDHVSRCLYWGVLYAVHSCLFAFE